MTKLFYLPRLKESLVRTARAKYDDGPGGPGEARKYRSRCYRIKSANSIGELLRIGKGMRLSLRTMTKLLLTPLLVEATPEDFAEVPPKW